MYSDQPGFHPGSSVCHFLSAFCVPTDQSLFHNEARFCGPVEWSFRYREWPVGQNYWSSSQMLRFSYLPGWSVLPGQISTLIESRWAVSIQPRLQDRSGSGWLLPFWWSIEMLFKSIQKLVIWKAIHCVTCARPIAYNGSILCWSR